MSKISPLEEDQLYLLLIDKSPVDITGGIACIDRDHYDQSSQVIKYHWYRPISTRVCSKWGYLNLADFNSKHSMKINYNLPQKSGIIRSSGLYEYRFNYKDKECIFKSYPVTFNKRKMTGVYVEPPSQDEMSIMDIDYLTNLFSSMLNLGLGKDIVLFSHMPKDENIILTLCSSLKIKEQEFSQP